MSVIDLAARGDVAALLAALRAGADPNPRPEELAPLYFAREPAVIAALLEHGADPNWQTEQGETALTYAAHDGDLERVRALLAGGADASLPRSAWPPLFYAAMAGHVDVVDALLEAGADPERVHDGRTALTLAVDHRRAAIAERILARAPGVARLGSVDPAGVARERGDEGLAARIDALRWSAPDEGLRGRLRVDAPTREGAPCLVRLELENVGDAARAVAIDDPFAFAWELWCGDEVLAPTVSRMDVMHRIGWTTLAPGEVATFALSPSAHWPTGAIVDVVTQVWTRVPAGRLHLRATYRANRVRDAEAPRDAVPIELALPSTWVPRAGG